MSVQCNSVGPCGLYCGSCPIYLARFNPELKTYLANYLNCHEDQVECNGCRELTEKCWGNHCKIRLCAQGRGLESCGECVHFPCDRLHKLSLGYRDVPQQQLKELRTMDRDEFMALMQKRWTCPCGHPVSAYTNKCIDCGAEAAGLPQYE